VIKQWAPIAACWFLMATPAFAQGPGVQIGVSGDPDQFYFGGHDEVGPIVDRLWFRPNAEVGIGDDETLLALNFELVYRAPLPRSLWRVYFGGGPALNIVRTRAETSPEGGFNILVGLSHRRGLFSEFKVGWIDSPRIKFGVGYTFR